MEDHQGLEDLRTRRWSRFRNANERTPMLRLKQNGDHRLSRLSSIFTRLSEHWVPAAYERDEEDYEHRSETWGEIDRQHSVFHERSLRRRVFLFLTDPSSSFGSAVFFAALVITITLSIVIMILQTMETWQFTPTDCIGCGGTHYYPFDGTFVPSQQAGVQCVCPPTPLPYTVVLEDSLVNLFSIEWTLRVFFFEPPTHERADTFGGYFRQWFAFLTDFTTILDALSIFPYYIEKLHGTQSLLALRLVKLFRVFPLLRLGQFNATFQSLLNVLAKSVTYLRLLIVVLVFGSAFFGSLMFYLERGYWKYYEPTETYEFVRVSADGITEELSPFRSIPEAFWWFMVTATTVGYGDLYPTSVGGKIVASFAMLLGVLVIAFPVSVFSDLWSKELEESGAFPDDDDNDDSAVSTPRTPRATGKTAGRVYMSTQDIRILRSSMQSIEENQRRIQDILLKYQFDDGY